MWNLQQDFGKWISLVQKAGSHFANGMAALALRARVMRRLDARWDKKFGVAYCDNVQLDSLNISSENKRHGFSYISATGYSVRVLLENLPENLAEFSFVDFGSGEGRVLLVASTYSFRDVTGVEFARELHEAANQNIQKVIQGVDQRRRVQSVHMDAARFEIPRGDCVLFFYNPFGDEVFEKVLKNIEIAHKECGKKIFVLYQQTRENLETDKSNTVARLRSAAFLTERRIRYPSIWARLLLGSQDQYIFESKQPQDLPQTC